MAAPIFAASVSVLTVEFVPAPEWTLHFCVNDHWKSVSPESRNAVNWRRTA
jgi:hypothetical protein